MVSSSVSTVTVNTAFLQEIKEVHAELWHLLGDLQATCQLGVRRGNAAIRFVGDLGLLRDQLALHFALEEAYGYFDDPAYVAPRLCESAKRLRREHQDLYFEICAIAEDAECTPNTIKCYRRLVTRFQDFHRRLMLHEQAEEDLILAIYDEDLGVGD